MNNHSVVISEELRELQDSILAELPGLLPSESNYPIFHDPDVGVLARTPVHWFLDNIFNPLAVEELLEEAVVLLERCISLRRSKLEMEVQAVRFWLSILEFDAKNDIEEERIAAGKFSLPAELALLEHEFYSIRKQYADKMKELSKEGAKTRDKDNALYKKLTNLSGEVAWLTTQHRTPAVKTKAKQLKDTNIQFDKMSVLMTELDATMSHGACLHNDAKASLNHAYEDVNSPLNLQTHEVNKQLNKIKKTLAKNRGSGLNYSERLTEMQQLFDRDYVDAYNRLRAVEVGIAELFGIKTPLPSHKVPGSLSKLLIWTRARITDLAIIQEKEVQFSYSVSCRSAIGDTAWQNFISTGTMEFTLKDGNFAGLNCLRMTGVQAYMVSKNAQKRWQLRLYPPLRVLSNLLERGVKVDGASDRFLFFADVGVREPSFPYGKSITRAFANWNPIGDWKAMVGSAPSSPLTPIEDLELVFDISAIYA